MITTLLISKVADYLAGVLHTTLTILPKVDPNLAPGAIAFYQDEFGTFPCTIIKKLPLGADGIRFYRIYTDPGFFKNIPSFELMTGWEETFPDWQKIDWGCWTNWTAEEVAEPLADDYRKSSWNPNEEWKPDDDYYSQLAQEYETAG